MNDTIPQAPNPTSVRKRPSRAKRVPKPTGEVTRVDVPRPPASAVNPQRLANALIMAQVEHIHHAEKNRLARHKLSGKHPSQIRTEAEAAAYISEVTLLLHPQGKKKKSKPRKGA